MSQPAIVVHLEEPARMNLLGLILRSLLTRNLAEPRLARRALALRGAVAIQAGDMQVGLCAEPGRLVIRRGAPARPRASVRGSLPVFLDIALGGSLLGPLLDGELHVGGNPLALLKLLPLIRARAARRG
ncbi:MAG TPA: hypothetical protein PK668_09675 [Myxococcota bacterium]|nr:hypothetical protein [Myxococcota bacterium]HRY92748.1 hypothetical protein [Myxococcota bacterium]